MPSKAAAVAIGFGAMAAQLPLLVLQGGVGSSQAMWGWSSTPQCIFIGGTCTETSSNLVDAGAKCTPTCSSTAIDCPSSTGVNSPDNGWWGVCGLGNGECKSTMEIGDTVTCDPSPTPAPAPAPTPAPTGTDAGSAAGLLGRSFGAVTAAVAAAAAGILGATQC